MQRRTYFVSLIAKMEKANALNYDGNVYVAQMISLHAQEYLLIESKMVSQQLQINQMEYLYFLSLLYIVSIYEQRYQGETVWIENAKAHAKKLIVAFGNIDAVEKYLHRYEQVMHERGVYNIQLIHNACLFSFPENDLWSKSIWQQIISKQAIDGPNDEIMRLLPFADKIQAYIANPENTKIIREIVKEDVVLKMKNEYKNDFKKAIKVSEEEWMQIELTKFEKIKKQPTKEDLQAAYRSEDKYIAYRSNYERFIESTVKTKMQTVIPFSSKTPILYISKIANNCIYQRASENPKAAALFFAHRIPEETFNLYLSLKPNNSHEFIPNVTIDGQDIDEDYAGFVIHKLDAANPEAAILGKLTGCCQSLGGQGEYCAIHGITDPRGGFYVLRDKTTNEVIAQCWAWYKDGTLVFDSIESSLNAKEKYKTLIMDFYVTLAHRLSTEASVSMVMVGQGGGTPKKIGSFTPIHTIVPVDYTGYSDSTSQWILSKPAFPFLQIYLSKNPLSKLSNPNIIITLNTKESEEWCDLCFVNTKSWKTELIEFALSNEEMEERTRLSTQWLHMLDDLDSNQDLSSIWASMKEFAAKINFNFENENGLIAFHMLARTGNLEAVKVLIDLGTDVNIKNKSGNTTLHIIARYGSLEVLEYLISIGADVNVKNNTGDTALHEAAKCNYVAVIKSLLKHGAKVNIKNNNGNTALHEAVKNSNISVNKLDPLKYLIEWIFH